MRRDCIALSLLSGFTLVLSGCYHYSFEQRPRSARHDVTVFKERRPTYLNGFIGTGKVDTSAYCEQPLRTELRVTGTDVLLSLATLLIYTPHTLYVTCPRADGVTKKAARSSPEAATSL